jgi:site-specific DNA recombinase
MENIQTQGNSGPSEQSLRYCLYARKSSESDERQTMSIDSQIKEMLQLAQKEHLNVVDVKQEAHSAKSAGQRPEFNKLIQEIQSGRFTGILAWAPDRLSRNAGDLGSIVDLLDQKLLIEIRTFGQRFTNSPSEKFLFMILGAQGKLENDQKGVNVKRGLRAKCEMGLWPAPAPTGYLNEMRSDRKGYVKLVPERAPIIKQMFEKVAHDGWSGRKVQAWLREINFKTIHGKPIWISSVQKILTTPFYYGEFQYPAKTGNWYKGVHEAIITKEVYEMARANMKIEHNFRYKSKEFAFTRLMKCGKCGSGVTAMEKYKKLAGGGTAKYIYYGCTRTKDIHCPIGYIREEDFIRQLLLLIDQAGLDELGLRKRLEKEMTRYKKFQQMIGQEYQDADAHDVSMRNYAKYILQTGSLSEKRELLLHLKDKILLTNKLISLQG